MAEMACRKDKKGCVRAGVASRGAKGPMRADFGVLYAKLRTVSDGMRRRVLWNGDV